MTEKRAQQQAENAKSGAAKRRLLLLVPFLLLLGLVVLFFCRIDSLSQNGGEDALPNALAGKPAPRIRLPLLYSPPGRENESLFDSAALRGKVTLVNFWGSWCPPCRAEHPFLLSLQGSPDFQLIGIDYKDSRENATRFLGSLGNPFAQIGYDKTGRAAIDWGVYGPPETFVLSKSGIILYRFIGPMSETDFREKIRPVILRAGREK